MSEILSQSEIDALLSALQSGEVDVEAIKEEENAKKVRVYDFRRPNKFSKDQLNTLEVIYDNFAKLLTTYLSGVLRTRIQIKVGTVEQLTYDEFTRSISNPTIMSIFIMPPFEGKAIMEISPSITFTMIDRLFGGPGSSIVKNRGLTEIERSVMEKTMDRILTLMKEAWEALLEVDPIHESIEINPQFTQITSPSDMVVIITLKIILGETEGIINVCLPCLMLEPVAPKLNVSHWFGTTAKKQTPELQLALTKSIEKARAPISVCLGRTTITLKELLDISEGDVISLDKKHSDPLDMFVDTRKKYLARPGVSRGKLAVQIYNKLEGSDDDE